MSNSILDRLPDAGQIENDISQRMRELRLLRSLRKMLLRKQQADRIANHITTEQSEVPSNV